VSAEPDVSHTDVWSGVFRGVAFRVVHWGVDERRPNGTWNFYLMLPEAQLPERRLADFSLEPIEAPERWQQHAPYSYMGTAIDSLEWHCGCTHYCKLGGADGTPVRIEMGCDYNHLYYEGQVYHEAYVISDACRCIDSLWEVVPDLLVHDTVYGGFVTPDGLEESKARWRRAHQVVEKDKTE